MAISWLAGKTRMKIRLAKAQHASGVPESAPRWMPLSESIFVQNAQAQARQQVQ
jgi:hypothetical protein